ncbi:MAG TPA: sigma-70 family RNA polymerase sigma factor [Gemmatimonadales bacterium]|nr:sigma-70 family RNA polymerase sigma factor [Gemmatimonadales bacterium]
MPRWSTGMRAWVAQVQDASTVTQLVRASGGGSREALDRLFAVLYDELRRVAHRQLLGQPRGATLNTTALIHEAYLRMVDQTQVDWEDRARFFGYAARTMRAIIVDYARRRGAQKRGGRLARLPFDDADLPIDVQADAILAVDEALTRLARMSERLSQIVECRFFGGMSLDETAAALSVSDRTVRRDWIKAKAWLYDELCGEKAG